jgi:hypothetical protein
MFFGVLVDRQYFVADTLAITRQMQKERKRVRSETAN